jgi:hypothetical protein
MALQSITNINVDFYDKKHILINAEQYDKNSRFISVSCYDHGTIYPINSNEHTAYVRYKKSDGYGVLHLCEISDDGKIIVELTEQMLAVSGICYVDLIVVRGGYVNVDPNSGDIVGINGSSILSTMTFCINVIETPVDNSEIESNYDFDALNKSLDALNAEYTNVILMSKSWAVGGTGMRNDESENNARYWAQVAAQNAVGIPSVVTSIKGSNEANYRNGQVVITADNVGAIPSANIATVNEVKNYLGI